MIKPFFCIVVVFSASILPFFPLIAMKQNLSEDVSLNRQDMPPIQAENPLRGFSAFSVISYAPVISKEQEEVVINLIQKELKKHGVVNQISSTAATLKEKESEISLFKGPVLSYEIKNVVSAEGKILPFVRASLILSTSVVIEQTQKPYIAYVWSRSCFFPGNIPKDLEKFISKSFPQLLHTFMKNYFSVNDEKPVFNLQL